MLLPSARARYRYDMARFQLPIESGRLVLLTKRRMPRVPMQDACFLSTKGTLYGKATVVIAYEKVAGHPGTLAARSIFVGDPKKASQLLETFLGPSLTVQVFAHAPRVLIADHTFVYQKMPDAKSEGARALRACEGNRRAGSFRSDAGDIGCCLRTGWRRCLYEVAEVDGGVAAQVIETTYPEESQ